MNKEAGKELELRSLMIASQGGDQASHRNLLFRLSGYLRAYFRRKLARAGRTSEEAEDLVQETLMAIHTRRHTYDPAELLTPWVYAIARYKLIDYLRQSRARLSEAPIEDASEVTAVDDRNASESSIDLGKLLAKLPEKVRMSIQYVKIEGLSVAETAIRCGISESAVKINIHRGLKTLGGLMTRVRQS